MSKIRALSADLVNNLGIEYPLSHIRETSKIIKNLDFVNGVTKILEKKELLLIEDVKYSVFIFLNLILILIEF